MDGAKQQINPLSNYIILRGIFFLCIHLSLVGIVASEKKEENENNVIKSIDFSLEAQAKQGEKFSHKNSRKWVVAIAYDSCFVAEFFFLRFWNWISSSRIYIHFS